MATVPPPLPPQRPTGPAGGTAAGGHSGAVNPHTPHPSAAGPDEVVYELELDGRTTTAHGPRARAAHHAGPAPAGPPEAPSGRRWLKPLLLITVMLLTALGGYAVFDAVTSEPDPVASPDQPTQPPGPDQPSEPTTERIRPTPNPNLLPPEPILVTDPDLFLTEPALIWTITEKDTAIAPGAASTLELPEPPVNNEANRSAVVVLVANLGRLTELHGIDAATGSTLWRSSDASDATRCQFLAQGRQVGCVTPPSEGEATGHVTVIDSATGTVYAMTNWPGDCIPRAVAGEASDLVVAGTTVGFGKPCLMRGPVWGEPKHSVTVPLSPPIDGLLNALPGSFLDVGPNKIAFQQDSMYMLLSADLSTVHHAEVGRPMSLRAGIGGVRLDVPDPPDFEDDEADPGAVVYGEVQTVTDWFTAPGHPWEELTSTRQTSHSPGVIGIGNTMFSREGEALWHLGTAPGNASRFATYTPVITLVIEQSWDPDTGEWPGASTVTAVDSRTGTETWRTPIDFQPYAPSEHGNALIWTTTDDSGDPFDLGAIHAMDARDGSPAWTLDPPTGLFDPGTPDTQGTMETGWPGLTQVGDTLVYSGWGTISGFRSAPTTARTP